MGTAKASLGAVSSRAGSRLPAKLETLSWGGCLYTEFMAVESTAPGRILALDVGSKTIGLAVSDGLGITAQGLETIRRRNMRFDLAALHSVIRRHGVTELVVGLPLRLNGKAGTQAEKVSAFAEQLREKLKIPVRLWDERLTSAQANRILKESEISIRKRAGAVDRLAAVLILQNFMENRLSTSARRETEDV
jgi:putative Holliday junction resolvase